MDELEVRRFGLAAATVIAREHVEGTCDRLYPCGKCTIMRMVQPVLEKCAIEADRRGDAEQGVYETAMKAFDVAVSTEHSIHGGNRPDGFHGRMWIHQNALPTPAEALKGDNRLVTVDTLSEAAANYLTEPWLSNGHWDWIFVDALARTHVVATLAELRRRRLDPLPLSIWNIGEWIDRGGLNLWVEAAFLIGGGWWIWHLYAEQAPQWEWWVLGALGYVTLLVIRNLGYLGKKRRLQEGRAKLAALLNAVGAAYASLRGPVLDPTRVRDQFRAAADLGSPWPTAVWPLLENAIRRDAAVWLTEP